MDILSCLSFFFPFSISVGDGSIQKYCLEELFVFVVVVLLFYVHGKHLRSCRDGQLT